ncbi:ATP-dependent DNA helicase [Elysia marginata]|uniref:ATP-dependent DNA helicase n=1 Tax=Elysia marginata TaxID=1093978 RepID=A0AAV4EWD3_9GAST|nr:ATP-dependent DNA helicase [Elysia marginata]
MCITESWLREQGDEPIIAAITPPGYTVKSYPRKDQTGGGIAFIFPSNDSSNYVINTSTSTHESFEAASANLQSSSFSCHILCVYRPPRSKKNCATNEFFLNEFRDVVQTLRKKYTRFMIFGDLNFHIDVPSAPETKKFISLLNEFELQQKIHVPTHKDGHTLDL